jgi:hypothetical protein
MEHKFKVGDKVKLLVDQGVYKKGDIHEITYKGIRGVYIKGNIENGEYCYSDDLFWDDELELVEEKRDRGGEGIGPSKASESQVDGSHYSKLAIQPIEYCFKNNLNVCQSKAIKYITRYNSKGTPLKDLEKAIHCLQLLIELEELKDE